MTEEIKPKQPVWKKWWFWLIIIFVIIVIASANGDKKITTSSTTGQPQVEQPTNTQKTYQEIFTFSGNGIKKSEPFNVQGDRFKIAYDCKGDPSITLCQAFVYKVGSELPQGIMNSTQPIKDETIIYTSMAGKGEYYIDANTLGSFTMTVYDYR